MAEWYPSLAVMILAERIGGAVGWMGLPVRLRDG
jgi:hypothetical protein